MVHTLFPCLDLFICIWVYLRVIITTRINVLMNHLHWMTSRLRWVIRCIILISINIAACPCDHSSSNLCRWHTGQFRVKSQLCFIRVHHLQSPAAVAKLFHKWMAARGSKFLKDSAWSLTLITWVMADALNLFRWSVYICFIAETPFRTPPMLLGATE